MRGDYCIVIKPLTQRVFVCFYLQEEELYTKDKRLDSLKERNLADGDQLDLVLIVLLYLQTSFYV